MRGTPLQSAVEAHQSASLRCFSSAAARLNPAAAAAVARAPAAEDEAPAEEQPSKPRGQRRKTDDETAQPKRTRRTAAEMQRLRDAGINPKTNKPVRQTKKSLFRKLRTKQATEGQMTPFTLFRDETPEIRKKMQSDPRVHEHLPLPDFWATAFTGKHLGKRKFTNLHTFFISNKETAKKVVSALELDKGEKKTVVEAYAGECSICAKTDRGADCSMQVPASSRAS